MIRMIRHLIVFLLIPALLGKPALAACFAGPVSPLGENSARVMGSIFEKQTIPAPAVEAYPAGQISAALWDQQGKHFTPAADRSKSLGRKNTGMGRVEFLAALGAGLWLMAPVAQAQSPQNWIAQLDDRDPDIRRKAREGLVAASQHLDFSQGQLKDIKPIFNDIDSAFTRALSNSSATHLASGLQKAMSHIMWQRALSMVQDLTRSSGYDVSDMYEAAMAIGRPAHPPLSGEDRIVKLNHLENLGHQYLAQPGNPSTSESFLHMTKSFPHQKDFYLSIHYAALAAVMQVRLKLWEVDDLSALMQNILDESEIDASLGQNLLRNFKIGEAAIPASSSPVWIFATARALGHNWAYFRNKTLAAKKKSNDLDQIDDFIADVLGLATLEAMGILQAAEIQGYLKRQGLADRELINGMLSDANPPATRWATLAEVVKQKVSGVNASTAFANFAKAVTETAAAAHDRPVKADARSPRPHSRIEIVLLIGA